MSTRHGVATTAPRPGRAAGRGGPADGFDQHWINANPSHPAVADLGLFMPDAGDWAEAAHDDDLLRDVLTALGKRIMAREKAVPRTAGSSGLVGLPY